LFVVGAEAAVVGASPFDGSVVDLGHLGRLDEDFAAAAVVVDVIGDEDALGAVLGAAFEKVDVAVLENGFGFDFAVAGGADGDSYVVEEVGAGFGHGSLTAALIRLMSRKSYSKLTLAPAKGLTTGGTEGHGENLLGEMLA
jgi:hypothetical protein